jgi:hypothetical protein
MKVLALQRNVDMDSARGGNVSEMFWACWRGRVLSKEHSHR